MCVEYKKNINHKNITSKAQWLLDEPPGLTFHNSTFCPASVFYVFCMDLRSNSDYLPVHHCSLI